MIHTLTLNPALDKILYLKKFEPNITNRVQKTVTVMGGKGTHVSMDLNDFGITNTAWGISFGPTGKTIIEMLESEQVITRFHHYPSPNSRTNYLLVEESLDCTILSNTGVMLKEEMLDALLEEMKEEIHSGDILLLSGDASNCRSDVYNLLMQKLAPKNLTFFVDTSGPSLKECIKASPFLIKPNLDELSDLCGIPIDALNGDEAICRAVSKLASCKIDVIAVSMGQDGSLIKYQDQFYRVYPPEHTVVSNTIGCGDCFLAGLAAGFSQGMEIEDILRLAAAASAATAESSVSVGFSPERAREFQKEVTVIRI